ncbi:MAG: transcriptional repressor [Spirochaetia bacterium]|jgi:Fe2+ or Zn2+ uptake regulation protein|nr:transcriptional repressor [Spirochaetia bacterium]
MSRQEAVQILQTHGIKPSYQRIKIYEYLVDKKNHPTVDTIYRELSPGLPTLSKTTVYNTLKLFHSVNVVQKVMIEDNEVRFDADTSIHGHFKCLSCGEVYDFPVQKNALMYGIPEGFSITDEHIYCTGYCQDCAQVDTTLLQASS